MTEQEKNIAVAKAVGLTVKGKLNDWTLLDQNGKLMRNDPICEREEEEVWNYYEDEGYLFPFCSLDCPHSLLALMRETIQSNSLIFEYDTWMRTIVRRDCGESYVFNLLNATPLQQVEAFLKTMGLWRED